ncbi:MAG: T9SS type A sorting domain-containing protein [Nonlabens sp.]
MKKIYTLAASVLVAGSLFAQAPSLVTDLHPGTNTNSSGVTGGNDSSPTNLFVFNGEIYFSADDGSGTNTAGTDVGRELYKTDGTAAGTVFIKDIRPGSSGSSPFNLFVYDSNLYFTAFDGNSELWTTDGTTAGTTKVDLLPSVNGDVPNRAVVYIADAFLTVNANGNNNQLFQWSGFDSSGNIDGEFAEDAANPASIVDVREIVEFDNGLFLYMSYSPDDTRDIGLELYKYDVATNTYTLIEDINPGVNGSGNPLNSGISNFTPFLTSLYFEALGNLYVSDSNTANEVPAANALGLGGVNNLTKMGDLLLFEADNGTTGDQLYRLDTNTGIVTQLSFIAGANTNHDPSDYVMFNGFIYYAAEDDVDDEKHLWRTDGNTITQLDDTVINVDDIVELNGILYFEGEDPTTNNGSGSGKELFSFNPATASIDQLTGMGSIKLAQNPVKNNLNLVGDITHVKRFNIYDLSGRVVQSGGVNGSSTIQHSLSSGAYILELSGSDHSKSIKFIVE